MDLPEELAILILKRSPPASLLRFKRVCKSWRCIISAPGFLQRSILVHNKSNKQSLAIIEPAGFGDMGFTSGLPYTVLESPTSPELGPLPKLPNHIFGHDVKVVGSCRGVVCFAKAQEGRCFLWNSTTGQLRSPCPHRSYNEEVSHFCFDHLGMGYYHGHGQLKVIKISTVRPSNGDPVQVGARIYELSSDSWREISPDGIDSRKMGPGGWIRSDLEPVHFIENDTGYSWKDGRMYSWICYYHCKYSPESECCVLSFDMASETFTSFSSVIPVSRLDGCIGSLVMNDLLALCLHRGPTIDVWVMLEYGSANSWAKLWSIQTGQNLHWVRQEFWHQSLKFWNGGLVMSNPDLDRLLWCDLSDPRGIIRTLLVHDFSEWRSLVAIFEKTRVSVNGESTEESSENHMNMVH